MQGDGRRCGRVSWSRHHSSGIEREAGVQGSIASAGPVSIRDATTRGAHLPWTDYLRDPRGVRATGIRVQLYPPGTCVVGDTEVGNPAACSIPGSKADLRRGAGELRGAPGASRNVSSPATD